MRMKPLAHDRVCRLAVTAFAACGDDDDDDDAPTRHRRRCDDPATTADRDDDDDELIAVRYEVTSPGPHGSGRRCTSGLQMSPASRSMTGANAPRIAHDGVADAPALLDPPQVLGDLVVGAEGEERRRQGVVGRETVDLGAADPAAAVAGRR